MAPTDDTPGLPMPPPLIPLVALAAAALLDWLVPLRFLGAPSLIGWQGLIGLVFVVGGFALAFPAVIAFRAAGTNVEPNKPSLALVVGGPYRFTRNPIYLGFLIAYSGLGLLFALEWGLALLPVVWLALDRIVVAREEAYLTRKFGADYEAFLQRTRRWV